MDLSAYNRQANSVIPKLGKIIAGLKEEIISCSLEYKYDKCELCNDNKLMIKDLEQVINKHRRYYN